MRSTPKRSSRSSPSRRAEPCSAPDLEARLEVDVRTQRVPDRAVLLTRERDRALDPVGRDVALDLEVEPNARQPPGGLGGALALEASGEPLEGKPALRQDVDHVDRHAACERGGECLDRGCSGRAVVVQQERLGPRAGGEAQATAPLEVDRYGRSAQLPPLQAERAPAGSIASRPSTILSTLPSFPITNVTRLATTMPFGISVFTP